MINVSKNSCTVRGKSTEILTEYAILTAQLSAMLADEMGEYVARHIIDRVYKLGTTDENMLKWFRPNRNPTFKRKEMSFDELLKNILKGGKDDE
mgnify:CR=1 FL=1